MIFGLFRRWLSPRSLNRDLIERVYGEINAAARNPILYTDFLVDDSFEGRFEMLTLHIALVLHRLNQLPSPGKDMAQDLVDTVFRHFEMALRELGVGDTVVPKKMKTLAEAFLGRCTAYEKALPLGESAILAAAAKNIYGDQQITDNKSAAKLPAAARLVRYILAVEQNFAAASLNDLLGAQMPFPNPVLIS